MFILLELIFFLILFYDFIILHCLKNICFVVTFILFSIILSWSHYLNHEFCKVFLDKYFLKKNYFVFNFCWFFIYFIQVGFVLYKNSYFEIIFLICSAMHTFSFIFIFILFTLFHMCFYFYYLLLILMNKFSGYKLVNILFCKIKYLDLRPSLNFFSFSFSYC
jgi:hypothetical protein